MWNFYMDNGTVDAESYPYVDENNGTGMAAACDSSAAPTPNQYIASTGFASGKDEFVAAIQERPLAAAFAVRADIFSFYSYGLIRPNDGNCFAPGTQPNHQMAIVGLDLVGSQTMVEVPQSSTWARMKTQADYDNGCAENEYEWPQYPMYCLWDEVTVSYQPMESGPYWKVQNSWGESWGHAGFAYFAIDQTDDPSIGNCSMYKWDAQYVNVIGE